MKLTRRDALAALTVGGVAVGIGATVPDYERADTSTEDATPAESSVPDPSEMVEPPTEFDDHERETLLAVARVVYPSVVTGVDPFVITYLDGRTTERGYAAGVVEAVEKLDGLGQNWYHGRFVELDRETQERLLREVGADTADPDPEGSPAERVRYYLVNELLFALYASPTGGELVGIENPQGHPGGLASYQRGPPE